MLLSSLLAIAACAETDPEPIDEPVVKQRVTVQLDTRDRAPLLVAFVDGDGAWQPLPINATNVYTFEVTNAYGFAAVCGGVRSYATKIAFALASDGDREVSCVVYDDVRATVAVTGEMMQPGIVSLWDSARSTSAPWTFALDVPPGTRDLFAFGADRALITRDVDITAAAMLPSIDVSAGEPYDFAPVTIAGTQADETLSTSLVVFTDTSFADAEFAGSAVRVLPESLLQPPFEFQFASIAAESATSYRHVDVDLEAIPLDGPVVPLDFMPRLEGVTLTNAAATWTTLPPGDNRISYTIWADAGSSNDVRVEATAAWAARHTMLPAELEVDGYLDAWRAPAVATRSFGVFARGYEASTRVISSDEP